MEGFCLTKAQGWHCKELNILNATEKIQFLYEVLFLEEYHTLENTNEPEV
jgi:hypothetical protein